MNKQFKKKLKITLLVIALVVGAAAIVMSMTNPTNSEHMAVIAEYLNSYDWSQVELNEEQQAQYTAYMSSGANANIIDNKNLEQGSFVGKHTGSTTIYAAFRDVTIGGQGGRIGDARFRNPVVGEGGGASFLTHLDEIKFVTF